MRSLDANYLAALASQHYTGVILLWLEFISGHLKLNNSSITLPWDGSDWLGAGALGTISSNKESLSGEVTGITCELSGVTASMVSAVLQEPVQGQRGTLYFGILDANYQWIGTPAIEFRGLCDRMVLIDSGDQSKVQLTIESRVIDFRRPTTQRYNSPDHQSVYPTDTFFNNVEKMADYTIIWPNKEFFKK